MQGFTTGSNKLHPEFGLPGLDAVIEHRGLLIPHYPDHDGDCECGFCLLHRELASHPVGETTDCLMSLWMSHEAARASILTGGADGFVEFSEQKAEGFLKAAF